MFTKVADDLDVSPALAAALRADLYWVRLDSSGCANVAMMNPGGERRLEAELAPCWALVDEVLARAADQLGDRGTLHYARLGRMPPGSEILPHADGYDGIDQRRYQIVLQTGPDADMIFSDVRRCMLPGEAWQVHVQGIHSVVNPGVTERINIVFDTWA